MAPFLISGGIAAAAVGALPPAAIDIALTLAVLAGVARLALLRRRRSERPASFAPSPERTLPC